MNLEWDVFISHASEDKASVVRPLASKLRRLGLKVWVDENELKLGDSLSRKIDEGLSKSRSGVVVLSPDFFRKNWPEYELRGLTAKAMSGVGQIIPIWHNVSQADVVRYSPTLADAYAIDTTRSLDDVALQISSAANPELYTAILRKIAREEMVSGLEVSEIPFNKLRQGPVRHPTLPNALVDRIDLIRAALLKVMPHSRNEWMDGFQRDAYPTKEIEIWDQIAARYVRAVEGENFSDSQEIAIFGMLLLSSTGQAEDAAKMIIKEFGENSGVVFEKTKYKPDIFTPISEQDRIYQAKVNVELQALAGPESAIDLSYIEEIVASKREIE